ncbi:MAG: biliverdin-producing heme oxygenase [Rhizobacter sp.]|nr:biliverdin-producing heme oxygenase [Rhizobacter sp.]
MPHDVLLLNELRARTRAEHAQIEALLRLTEPMSLARYAGIVGGFHEFLLRWEPRLAAALPPHLRDWCDARRRSAFAADDLQHLHRRTPAATAEAAHAAVESLGLSDTASALGSMYVIEGSALGGQVIEPLLHRHLGPTAERGARYFHGHGEATGAMWRDFRSVIARELGSSDAAVHQACSAARRTFRGLASLFGTVPA